MRRTYILGLLVLSGFAGLAYELLWVRLLALSMGSTTLSFSTVLAVFFGGLALGSRWAGRRSVTNQRPIATYALLEALTGALGLLLLPVMKHLGPLFAWLDPGAGPGGLVVRLLVSAVILLPPTFLMGATLPFVCAGTIERDEDTGRGTGLVYGLNTLGACLGAYGITFWLLPNLGVTGSTLVVVGLNAVVAVIAFLGARRSDGLVAPTAPAESESTQGKLMQVVLLATFTGGFAATGAQIVWSRFFAIALEGTAYGLGSVLVSVLVGIALGSLLAARWAKDGQRLARKAGWVQWTFAFGLASFAVVLPVVAWLLGTLPNAGLLGRPLLHAQLVVVWVALAVPTIASGASLPMLVSVVEHSAGRAGVTLSRLYAANTVGCILGSLFVGFWLLPALGSNQVLYLLTVLVVAALAIFLLVADQQRAGALALTGLALAIAAFFPGFDARAVNPSRQSRQDPFSHLEAAQRQAAQVSFFHEGDVATVSVTGDLRSPQDPLVQVSLNGLGQGGRGRFPPELLFESTLVGAVPWVHAANPRRGLVVGLGAGGTVRALVQLGVPEIEVVELERGIVDAMPLIWGDKNPLDSPQVTLVVDDARHRLLVTSRRNPHQYDFITSMPAHPWIASSLFTREFFELAKANLAPGGVFATWFGARTTGAEAMEPLFGAFTAAFPHAVVYWVGDVGAFYVVGSEAPLELALPRLEQLAASPVLSGEREDRRSALFLPLRVAAVSSPTAHATARLANTDDNSMIEFAIRRPLVGSAPDALTYFPVRWLPLTQLRGADSEATLLQLVEGALGTPEGRLPQVDVSRTAAQGLVESLSAGAPKELVDYARARVSLLLGKRADAEQLVDGLSSAVLRTRGRKFLAASAPRPERAQQLLALSPDAPPADVQAQLVAGGSPPPEAPLAAEFDDPLGWLFSSAPPPADPDARGALSRAIADRVARFGAAPLSQRCADRARAALWRELERACDQHAQGVRRAVARQLVERASKAVTAGRFPEAVALLRDAHGSSPLTDAQALLLLRAAVRVGDPTAVGLAREIFRARGLGADTVDAMQAEAARALDLERAPAPDDDAPPPPGP